MTSERSKRRDFLTLVFISKSISKKLLIKKRILIEKKSLYLFSFLTVAGRKGKRILIERKQSSFLFSFCCWF